jgi:hypothetical protein
VIGRLIGLDGERRCLEEPVRVADALEDDDLHLALYLCYELSYRGLAGVGDEMEWDPALLSLRSRLEASFEEALRSKCSPAAAPPADLPGELRALAQMEGGPSLSRFMERDATAGQFREFLLQRSAYHLKEADPHSFAIPRLAGAAKAALMEIQADEYGDGDAAQMHSELFAGSMLALGLDARYGHYIDRVPGATLAHTNLISLFGLHRRLRGALIGHLALFELTSSIPNRRYGNGLRRCGFPVEATRFFDVHVEADAVHGAIASTDMVDAFVAGDPDRAQEVYFGARSLQLLDASLAASWVRTWRGGGSTLRGDADDGRP